MKKQYFILPLLLLTLPLTAVAMSFDSNSSDWIQLGPQDSNEGGHKNDWRDVEFAFYQLVSSNDTFDLKLKLSCYGVPGSEWPDSGGRYKWFFDVSDPSDMYLSGGNIVGAEYLVYVEYSEVDGSALMLFLEDVNSDGSFNDETPFEILDGFEVVDNSIIMTLDINLIGPPSELALTWATDQEDPNRDAAPNNDRVDGKIGIAGVVELTSITVVNLVVGTPPSGVWKYDATGPEDYVESFNLPAGGSPPVWISAQNVPGNYVVTQTTKFGYHTYVEIRGDSDGGTVITGTQVDVDLDEGELITIIYTNTFLPAFAISLDSAPPANLDYDIPTLIPKFAQSAWSTDINGDNRTDLVYEKPAAVMVNFTGVNVGSSVSISLDFLGTIYTIVKTNAELAANSIIAFYPIIPDVIGDATLTGSYSVDGGSSIALTSVDVTVKETTGPPIAYSYLYRVDKKGNPADYESVTLDDFLQTVGNSTMLLNTTYPVSNLLTDEDYIGVEGAKAGSRRDPFKGLLEDALTVAQSAQLRMGGSAIGIGIGPNNPGIDDYFTFHGFPGAAGISFGPSVKGVLMLDGYYGGSAHEVAHTYGLYYGMPEEYQLYPLYGTITSGVRVETGEWMTGYDIMGAVAYGTLEDTWIDSDTFAQLFTAMANNPEDPMVLLASGIINSNGTVEFPNTWYSLETGYPESELIAGDYSLVILLENGNEIETSFDAQFQVQIGGYPAVQIGTDGDQINQTAFQMVPTNSTGFSFTIPYYPGAVEVQIWNNTSNEQIGVVDASDIVHLTHHDVESWTTSSTFVNTTSLDANFKKDGKTKTSTLISTNPGTMYLNVLIENLEAFTINPTVTITLPNANDSLGELISPAFYLKGANPIHVYSDLERKNDVTQDSGIIVDGKSITLELIIPNDGVAYMIIHLDYALKGSEGWPFNASQTYLQDTPFNVYSPHIMEDGSVVTDITVPFEVVGAGLN